jgi:hypothetical protein
VFFLPEKKSPYQRYYTTGRQGYGGTQRIEGRTTFENPIIAKGASGGKVPERAYDAINGQGAYDEMRQDVLDATTHGWNRKTDDELTQNVANVLEQYGGSPDLAEDIVRNSKGGNTLPYAVQEHIVASSVRKAGHDGIIGFSKIKGQPRLSEVFDLRHDKYPISSELFESKSPTIYTSEGAQPLADKLGARVVGSVAKKGESARDLDLRIDGDYNEPDVIAKMKQSGYESRGSSLVSPQEAKSSGKSYGSLGWKRAEHFENEDGHKIDVWHDEPDKDAPNLQGLRTRNVKPQVKHEPVGIHGDDVPRGSNVPDVDWQEQDLQDTAKNVTPESIAKDYGPKRKNAKFSVYQSHIPMEDLPSAKIAEEEDAEFSDYDWRENYQGLTHGITPPIKVRVTPKGVMEILDGNHRARLWEDAGMTHAPAWVMDERGKGIENLSENEKAEIAEE